MRLFAFLLVASTAGAQAPDPRPAWTYDPVAVGNVRSYAQGGVANPYWRVDHPTEVTFDGQRWVVRRAQRFGRLPGGEQSRSESRSLVRFDSVAANVVYVAPLLGRAPELLYPCRLDVPLTPPEGGTCGDGIGYVKTAGGRLSFDDPAGFRTDLQAGIGRVSGDTDFGPPFEIVGALIDGDTLLAEPEAFPDSRIDPTPATRYAPMSVGDEWQYERSEGAAGPGRPVYRRVQAVEAREIDGRVYLGVRHGSFVQGQGDWAYSAETTYARFDTLSARVVGPDGVLQGGACSFDEPTSRPGGDAVFCEVVEYAPQSVAVGSVGTVQVGADEIEARLREYLYTGLADFSCGQGVYAAGLGYVGYECSAPGAYERLIYARVRQPDGTVLELGRRYAVSARLGPEVEGLALTAGPNPTAGLVTLRLRLPAGGAVRWQAFDALGRVVWQRDEIRARGDAALALDASDWPAGLYQVRTATEAGGVTATVVRR